MASYRIEIKRSASRELEHLPLKDRRRIVSRIRGLASDPKPYGSQKLSGEESYRLRQGDYRVVYKVDETERNITVFRIAHRRDVYR